MKKSKKNGSKKRGPGRPKRTESVETLMAIMRSKKSTAAERSRAAKAVWAMRNPKERAAVVAKAIRSRAETRRIESAPVAATSPDPVIRPVERSIPTDPFLAILSLVATGKIKVVA